MGLWLFLFIMGAQQPGFLLCAAIAMEPLSPMTDIAGRTRPTIAFLSANIHVGASRVLWPGILDAAVAGNANLICYPGGRLRADDESEAMRNFLYDKVDARQLDGLVVWTSALAGNATPDEVAELLGRFNSLPKVDLASSPMAGPSVSINGSQGMRALVFHLVEQHGYERIALIRGPEGHPYAQERHRAYLDALTEKNIMPDERLISPALGWSKGDEAMAVLLDERALRPGVDFEAVVAASDLLAIGALNLLGERGVHVPTDVAVVGFNDIEEGRLVRPPLTSVSLPFYEQGRQAVGALLALVRQEPAPEPVTLDSRLLVRQSCGCPSWSEQMATVELRAVEPGEPPQAYRRTLQQLEAQIAQVIRTRGVAATWAKQLLDAFRNEMAGARQGRFRATLDGMLQQGILDGDETAAWQNAISILRCELLPFLPVQQRAPAEALLGQARVVIGDAVQRAHISRQLQAERQSSILRDIGQALISTFDVDGVVDVLADRLPELGIRSAYLALHEPGEDAAAARLLLAYTDDTRFSLEAGGRRFPAAEIVPQDVLPLRRHTLLIEPLFFGKERLGIIALEVGPRDGDIYEVLRAHISTAFKGALLFHEAHEAQIAAEKADQIKARLLANVSHELRTPLNIIISHAQHLRQESPDAMASDLTRIERSAEHQLRLINDLLDLSRAEINALDLYPMMLDPRGLIVDAFTSMARDKGPDVAWRLDLAEELPIVAADPVRLRQIMLNLLSNAARSTPAGEIVLGAAGTETHLHIWVADTGAGIPPDLIDHIYEPFVKHDAAGQTSPGIGLGLSITRHLVHLHDGFLEVDSKQAEGSTFHVYLPLPRSAGEASRPAGDRTGVWLVSRKTSVPEEVVAFRRRQSLELRHVHPESAWEDLLHESLPSVVIWDTTGTRPEDWQLMKRLHNHPQLHQLPFVLYQESTPGEAAVGLTSMVVKPAGTEALWAAIRPSMPGGDSGTVLIVDDDPRARELSAEAVRRQLPGYRVRLADNGLAGLAAMREASPDLVILDLMMPELDGFGVLRRMRDEEHLRQIPVVILSGRRLTQADIAQLEQYSAVTLRSKDVHTLDEIAATLHESLFGTASLPPHTSALAKQAIALIHQQYNRPLSRRELAEELGVSEDYFSRTFSQEMGISPWDYLNRYRVAQAKQLLRTTNSSVRQVAQRVGFNDPAYFSRVFSRLTGQSPSDYRDDV